eukprot:1991717-Prymnesium_polylepis.1
MFFARARAAVAPRAGEVAFSLQYPGFRKMLRAAGKMGGALLAALCCALSSGEMSAGAVAAPTKLVVVQHGLYGGAASMRFLESELKLQGGEDVLVHCCGANEGARTRDGVAAGAGARALVRPTA